ncbi:glycosyltransferase family 39 protein [Dyella sp. 2HG41-7]|uniref:glycosyltransferase family 39 protein n=1 Tax=Dyella sp. 2HG41-7 TaxID=2883239 RepID=UPI001F439BB9|nr:glycosyltransferase family 39 protein [Dyella sp. 2HG41-7]
MNTRPAASSQSRLDWPCTLYALIALIGCVFAFIGLSSNSFWADELFTMQVVGHHQGLGEVFRRVLADVHPPLYDFLLYGWINLVGASEWAVRLLSAMLAVLSLVVFAFGTRRRLSPTAIAFACAVASTSLFWYEQSQNARNYTLAILISSALLAAAIDLYRRTRLSARLPVGAWLWLTLLGIAGSQVHPYMLLTVGMLLLYLLLTSRTWPMRIAMGVSGLIVLGLYVGLLWLMTHTSAHDFHDTWYSNKASFFLSHLRRVFFHFMSRQSLLVIVAMLVAMWLRRSRRVERSADAEVDETGWTTALCGVVCAGVTISGIAVSLLIAPSFSYRNVLVCAPFGWFLIAKLYDVAGPRVETRMGAICVAAIVLLIGSQSIALIRGRFLPSNEPWRESAAYVQSLPGCDNATIPVVTLPGTYGIGMTPAVHDMIERHYYGYYLPASYRPYAYEPDDLIRRYADAAPASSTACPVVAWTLHDISSEDNALALAKRLASQPGLADRQVVVQEIVTYDLSWLTWKPQPSAFVFLRATPSTVDTQAVLTHGTATDRTYSVGDRLLVTAVPSPQSPGVIASYRIRRWHTSNGTIRDTTTTAPATSQNQ